MNLRRTIGRAALSMVISAIVLGAVVLLADSNDPAYRASVDKWRQNYEASLRSDNGWLTVAGLFWLHEGENRFGSDPLNDIVLPAASVPAEAGSFAFHAGKATVKVKPGSRSR
jgi:uncharacterized protein